MPSPRRTALILFVALAAAATGGTLLAQLESGERGILPIDSSGTLEITGIHVDVGGKDAASARFAGWRIAQREGFKALWAKTNKRPISEAPTLSDSTLDGLVASIIVEREQIGPNRYVAELGVLFD
ncbi:MAG: heavy-metal-associated domain-containing protein, partial [Pseudomonadota bacterium]|nr:heavy-metal-associated domain-containing protein [Pseudomonadota bacterium]